MIKPKNIIFDLGGVLINLDYLKTSESFVKLGLRNFDEIYSKAKQNQLFDRLETGKISSSDFYASIREISNLSLTDIEIEEAWNAMLLDFPLNRLKKLEEIKTNYRIFLLSNTNEIHIEGFYKILESGYGRNRFEQLFEKVYYSNRIGMRKPDKEIFEYVIGENGLKKEETIFIDDSPQHIAGAVKCGIQAYLLKEDLINALPKWLNE